jgi:hypothetical protein
LAYWFAGFFARPATDKPLVLPDDAVWRAIEAPFSGVGVRLPSLLGESPSVPEITRLAGELGMNAAEGWLFIVYTCWGGRIDSVYGLGRRGGRHFGPVEESDLAKVKAAYVTLMGEFGISEEDAFRFTPFERGFWGESNSAP